MSGHKQRAPGRVASDEGSGKVNTGESSIADLSMAGKAIAMTLYNCGARSLRETETAFRAHPLWMDA
jgi:hypothetical protein